MLGWDLPVGTYLPGSISYQVADGDPHVGRLVEW